VFGPDEIGFSWCRESAGRGALELGLVGFHLLSWRPPLDADMAEGKGTEACSNRVKDTEGLIYRTTAETTLLVMLRLCLRGGEATMMACPRDILQGVCEAHKLALDKLREQKRKAREIDILRQEVVNVVHNS
jgi:hypothetical protein